MHVLVQTGLDNMQACMKTMLPQRVSLVAPLNVIFHPVGQLAPPTLDSFRLMHLNWRTQPKGPRAAVHLMEQGRHVHPNRGAEVLTKERQRIQAAVRVLPQGQVDRAVCPYCDLILALLIAEEGLSSQVFDECLLPQVRLGCSSTLTSVRQSPESCQSSSTRTYRSAHSVKSGRMSPRRRGFTMFPSGSLTRTDTSSFRVLAMMRSKSGN